MTGNPALDKALIALNGIVVLAATGLIVFAHTSIKRKPTDSAKEMKSMVEQSIELAQQTSIPFKKMTINLYSRQTRLRFLDVTMNIEVFEPSDKNLIMNFKPYIKDTLIQVASEMEPNELNSVTGRILLENRVKNNVNSYLKKKAVKRIYFSKFTIQ